MRRSPFAPPRRGAVARTLLTAALAVGYVDLIRGGIVLAPLALVVAYLLLVPVVLLLAD